MERLFLNLKMERVWQRQYANHDEARRDINQYIVGFYNSVRLHSTLGYLSPSAYEAKAAQQQPSGLSEITWPRQPRPVGQLVLLLGTPTSHVHQCMKMRIRTPSPLRHFLLRRGAVAVYALQHA